MRQAAFRARPKRRQPPKDQGTRSVIAANVLEREFEADGPNQKWVADFTYVWTAEGWLYVAAVIDLFSRRVVGWSMSEQMTSQMVTDALIMAIWRRGRPDELLHHSDQGSQGGFNRSSQHFVDGGLDDKNRQTKVRTFDPGQIELSRKAASLATRESMPVLAGGCRGAIQ